MTFTKIIGWLTFLAGVSIILFTLYSSYNVFTGKMAAPEIFEAEKEALPPKTEIQVGPEEIPGAIIEQLKGIFPTDSITKFLNLSVWMMLAGILIFGGTQVANLGIKLLTTSPRKNIDSDELKTPSEIRASG